MNVHKKKWEMAYRPYRLYPDSFESGENDYFGEPPEDNHPARGDSRITDFMDDSENPFPEHEPANLLRLKPSPSIEERGFRPLRLLNSLFADRLSFLQRALDELEAAKNERERLIKYALDELDPEIRECEVSLSALKAAQNNTERRRNLESRLFTLKRTRRQEALTSWRDITWLKGEIRKLHREIDALTSTTGTAEKRHAPT